MQPIPAAERSERGEVDELRTILVTTDFSGISDEAFDSARISAERFGAQLIAAHLQENTLSGVIEDHLSVDDMKTFVALQRKEADVVVMATHGRKFIFHLLLGSTTEQVIRRSPCPVFVVRGRHS